MDKIDLIVPWVDGNDPKWLEEKRKYDGSVIDDNSNSSQRYRDWDLMRYFFRGIDKNMPWINKVFFVTWGHVPDWLDVDSPRLRIVKHTDYIPEKYLPTFNSNVIELNYHRIEDLSENFILFNDDCFAVDQVKPEFFFKNGKPCDMLVAKTLVNYDLNAYIWHTVLNDMGIINKYYKGGKEAFKHFNKWVNVNYGAKNNFMNLTKMGNSRLSSFYDTHLPLAHKKSVFEKAWKMEDENLDKVCMNRFRSPLDLNHWMMRYYNLAHGNFEPFNVDKMGKYYDFYKMEDSLAEICDAIKTKQRPVLVINDTLDTSDESVFESYKTKVQEAFEVILPDKCSFERN